MNLNPFRCIPVLIALVTVSCLAPAIQAATLAIDDFSTNSLNGGNGWVGPWTGGQATGEKLIHRGNNPQQLSRTFSPPALTQGAMGTAAGFFSIKADLKFTYATPSPNQNYGFRTYQDGQGNGTFSTTWERDTNGGQLTFLAGNGQTVVVPGLSWNIASTTNTDFTYTMIYDVTVRNGQNPGQFSGTYQAQIVRSDGLTYTTGMLPWIDSNKNLNNFQRIVFHNGSQETTLSIDNVTVATTSQLIIPEPGSAAMILFASGLLLRRRARRSVP